MPPAATTIECGHDPLATFDRSRVLVADAVRVNERQRSPNRKARLQVRVLPLSRLGSDQLLAVPQAWKFSARYFRNEKGRQPEYPVTP